MTTALYMTLPGDTVDSVCWTHYGSVEHVTRVLEANPGLAGLGPLLPPGTEIHLPELAARRDEPPALPAIHLWD